MQFDRSTQPNRKNPVSQSLTFRFQIDCDNAAFEGDNLNLEIARCLHTTAERIEAGESFDMHQNIRDINGNIVGTFALKPSKEFK